MRLHDGPPSRSPTPSRDLPEPPHERGNAVDSSMLAGPSGTNGHFNGVPLANGHASLTPRPWEVVRVTLPGTALYEGSHVDREEFVRLVIQSLRDVGYA
jgi:WD repeat-containing protein 26